jgi:hypothetical protein
LASGLTRNHAEACENAEKTGDFENATSANANTLEILPLDPGLQTVASKWASLPPAIRAGILAMVNAASAEPSDCDAAAPTDAKRIG